MMTTLIRWTHGLVARVDTMIAQVENHDALAASAIRQIEEAVARARVQLRRVQKDGTHLARSLAEERVAAEKWKERARTDEDDDRALECLRRARHSERRVTDLTLRLESHEKGAEQLRIEVLAREDRLRELRRQRHSLRLRASNAEAATVIRTLSCPTDVEDVFERWEMRIEEFEPLDTPSADPFEEDFSRREDEAELRADLAALRSAS